MTRRTFLLATATAMLALSPLSGFAAKKNKKKSDKKKEKAAKDKANAKRTKSRAEAFLELDKDGDGFLIGEEIPKGSDKLDKNGDGRLSRAEYSRGGGKKKAATKKKK